MVGTSKSQITIFLYVSFADTPELSSSMKMTFKVIIVFNAVPYMF